MPRKARVVVPHTPHHIVQRGHNHQVVFVADAGYQYYLDYLFEWKAKYDCKVYAWCLMTNHVHLIIDPGEATENLGKLMKRLAGRQTRYVNRLERRSGSLWEGRYKSSPIETQRYLLACCRYVELNPVRAAMVTRAGDYRWSSYRAKVGLTEQAGLDQDPCYLGLGGTPAERMARYREWVDTADSKGEAHRIREALQHGHPTGSPRFAEAIEQKLGVRISVNKPGRPRKAMNNSEEGVV